jgi:hypothetical protein
VVDLTVRWQGRQASNWRRSGDCGRYGHCFDFFFRRRSRGDCRREDDNCFDFFLQGGGLGSSGGPATG